MFRPLHHGIAGLLALAIWSIASTSAQAQFVSSGYFSTPGFTSGFVTGRSGVSLYYRSGRQTAASGYTLGRGTYGSYSYYRNGNFASAIGSSYGRGYPTTVLTEGLRSLPRERLRQLLIHPALLLALQELVLGEGGEYWERLLQATPPAEELPRVLRQFKDRLPRESGKSVDPWYRRPWLVSLLTAAAVLLIVLFCQHFLASPVAPPAGTGWGWATVGVLPSDVAADAYLNALADRAGEWFNARPEQPQDVDRRIAEFRQGCSRLIFAEHKPLSPADRQWLVERCRLWAAKLDKLREEVEAGHDAIQVRGAADQTIDKLIAALRARGREVGARG